MHRGMEKWGRTGNCAEKERLGSRWLIVKNKCVRWWTNSSLLMSVFMCVYTGEKNGCNGCWYKHAGPVTANKRGPNNEKEYSKSGKLTSKPSLQWSSRQHLKFIIHLSFHFPADSYFHTENKCRHLLTGNLSGLCRVQGLLSLASLTSGLRWQRWEGYFKIFEINNWLCQNKLVEVIFSFTGVFIFCAVKLASIWQFLLLYDPTMILLTFG